VEVFQTVEEDILVVVVAATAEGILVHLAAVALIILREGRAALQVLMMVLGINKVTSLVMVFFELVIVEGPMVVVETTTTLQGSTEAMVAETMGRVNGTLEGITITQGMFQIIGQTLMDLVGVLVHPLMII
jgi:hypothetical protein